MIQHWTQPLAWVALGILVLVSIYAAIRAGTRAYYKSRAEYESEKKSKKEES
jgi:hypothetical protein